MTDMLMNRNHARLSGRWIAFFGLILVGLVTAFLSCGGERQPEVIVYTSLDQTFSEAIFREFEQETGIRVRAIYDTEAAKTTGLVNRLLEEKDNPRADVFWNSETMRTVVLKRRGVLTPYKSAAAERIPDRFRDPDGYWTGFAARMRVLVCNTDLLAPDEMPRSIFDLVKPDWKGRFALANPMFGTTATHCAALFAVLGEEEAKAFFRGLKENDVAIVAGNATSKDRVAAGEFPVGFTDTDDVFVALGQDKPVAQIFPDQDGMGALLIPNTVALIRKGPHPEEGKKLIDFILSEEIESRLAHAKGKQIPLRPVPKPSDVPALEEIQVLQVDYEEVADQLETSARFLQELFLR
jgi:iron(III) transport system substrate-binding protein